MGQQKQHKRFMRWRIKERKKATKTEEEDYKMMETTMVYKQQHKESYQIQPRLRLQALQDIRFQ
jgi:hypothetical protein